MVDGVAQRGQFVVFDGLALQIPLFDVADTLTEFVTAVTAVPLQPAPLCQQVDDLLFVAVGEPLDAVECYRQATLRCRHEGPVVLFDDAQVECLLSEHLLDDGGVGLALDVFV